MSKIITIHTKGEIVKDDLFFTIKEEVPNLKGVLKSEEALYFYSEGTSIRGIDFLKEENSYSITLNSLSTKDDYKIAAIILKYFYRMQKYGMFSDLSYTVEGEALDKSKVWFREIEKEYDFEEDAEIIKLISEVNQSVISIVGPTREAHIGPYTLQKLGAGKQGWVKRLHAHLLKVMYKLPENQSDNVMVFNNNDGNEIIMKLVAANVQYVLGLYDYICFSTEEEKTIESLVVVTNEILNENLPDSWKRIDDYTIVAPGLNEKEYLNTVQKLKVYDCKQEIFGKNDLK